MITFVVGQVPAILLIRLNVSIESVAQLSLFNEIGSDTAGRAKPVIHAKDDFSIGTAVSSRCRLTITSGFEGDTYTKYCCFDFGIASGSLTSDNVWVRKKSSGF